MNLPLAFKDYTLNIKNELRAVAAKHNVNYGKVVGKLKNVIWANATNYITGRINEHLSTKFVNTFTYPLEQKLSETLHNFFHDTFDVDGKGKLSKEEKKKLKEEKKLEKQRDQGRVAKQWEEIMAEQERLRNEVQYALSQDEESPAMQSAWQFADKPNPKPCVKPKTSDQKAKAEPADKTKQEEADPKSKGDSGGYTPVSANNAPQMSYPKSSNPLQGSMSFTDQEALNAHRRSTGELNIRDSQGRTFDIPALASMTNKDQTAIVPNQDPEQTSIVGYNKPQNNAPKAGQNDALNTAGNFGRAANALRFMLNQGGKTAASTVARASLAEAGALALGGSELGGAAFIASQPELWIPVGLVAAWYYRDEIASGCKSAYRAITSGNEPTPAQPEFNSSDRVQEISQQEYDATKGNTIRTKPEYSVGQGPSCRDMDFSKPVIKQPTAASISGHSTAIPTPASWSEAQTPVVARGRTTVDDTKPLAISTPVALMFANVANISTTFDPIPQEEPLPPLVPPYKQPELNLFQKCPIRLEAREGMREDAKAAIKDEVCPILGSYSNQKLAQTLVDIACGVEFNPLFADVSKRIAGTFQHTHLKDVNEAYSRLCGDDRFESEVSYKDGKSVPMGLDGSIRVDLRTIEKNKANGERFEVYDLKTGIAGINQTQLGNFKKHLPDGANTVIYEIRPRGGMPVQVYP